MRLLFTISALVLLTACPKDTPVDTGELEDPVEPEVLGPMTSEVLLSAAWRNDSFPSGYSVAGTSGGLITTFPDEEVVLRLPWGVGQGVVLEDVAEVVAEYPGGADALRTFPDGSVNLAFGVMGGGFATYYPFGVDGLIEALAEDAPITILGGLGGGYTGRVFLPDLDGDDLPDLSVVEGTVPGNVRVFSDVAQMSGDYDAADADVTLDGVCAESRAYGPTHIDRFGDGLVAVGCASQDFNSGLAYIYSWPLSTGQTHVGIVEDVAGWYGATRGDGHPLYMDRRGRGQVAILDVDGENLDHFAPDDAGSRFGASPVLTEMGGRWYLVVGDQSWGDPRETVTAGRVTVCDITDEPIPEGDWFADCIHLDTPDDSNLEFMGAGVDADAMDLDGDGIDELVVTATGWQFGGSSAPGVAAWAVRR